jgi:hypothetical protein
LVEEGGEECDMQLANWANIAQIAQAVLVIISFGFIVYQIRASYKLARAANTQSLTAHAASFNSLLIEHANVAKLWYSHGKNLEEVDKYRYREMLVQWLIFHANIYYQREKGLLDDEIYLSWLADLKYTIKNHNLAVIGSNPKELFPGKFGRHMVQLESQLK